MADVQLENGFTKIANETLENIARIKLSPTQYRLIFVIWRYTYGFNRKEHGLSLKFLSEATGCDSRQIQRELKSLEKRKVIIQNIKSGSYRKISFNKNHEQWVGKTAIGETTIGQIDNGETVKGGVGEIDNGTFGETVKATIGETDNQEIKNKENLKEKSKEKDDIDLNPFQLFEQLFGYFPPPLLIQDFNDWIDESQFQEPNEIICETIRRAKKQTPKQPDRYISKILNTLHDLELYTLEAVQEYNKKFDQKIKQNKRTGTSKTIMSGKPVESTDVKPVTDKELDEIRKMEEELPF